MFAHVEGVPMVIMQGRVHYYEGYPMSDVVPVSYTHLVIDNEKFQEKANNK